MKGPKFFLDTNIFLRIVAKDDAVKLLECEKLIEKIKSGSILAITSSLVLAEVVWTCQKGFRLTKSEAFEIAKSIMSIKNLKFQEKQQISLAMDLFEKQNVKFVDCLIASHPEIATGKMAVISYDKDFDILGLERVEPAQLV